jgi:hypothetical protein
MNLGGAILITQTSYATGQITFAQTGLCISIRCIFVVKNGPNRLKTRAKSRETENASCCRAHPEPNGHRVSSCDILCPRADLNRPNPDREIGRTAGDALSASFT